MPDKPKSYVWYDPEVEQWRGFIRTRRCKVSLHGREETEIRRAVEAWIATLEDGPNA